MANTKKEREITPEILEQIKQIPAGAIGIQSDAGLIQVGIKVFFILKVVFNAVKDKIITPLEVIAAIRALADGFKVNHCFVFWGSGEQLTIDALPQGIRKMNLLDKIKNGTKIRMYYNKNVTVANLQIAKAYSYGSVGKMYSFQDFASIALDVLKEVLPKLPSIPPTPIFEHCTENAVVTQDIALTGELNKVSDKLLPEKKERGKLMPQEVENYLETPSAKVNGWVKCFEILK